jgi:Neisseria PilC beta-propeller domain
MYKSKRVLKAVTAIGLPLALGVYWLIAHAAIASLDDQPVGYVAALDMNNYDLSSGASVAYRGDFFRGNWDGDLVAYDITSGGGTSVKWQARDLLAAQPWDTGRKIFTVNGTTGVPFVWTTSTSSLSTAQQADLGGDPQGRYVLEFTRGDGTREGAAFRQRLSKLGDIIHSRPYYVKHSSTVERVYAGANDGMLHAFDAKDGKEVFAYIPSMLVPKLSQYAVNPYVNHKYGVDGLLSVATFSTSGSPTTLLTGALGAGGKGLFMLDITNPSPASETAAAAMAKWEITDATSGFGNLGHVYGAAPIVKLNNGKRVVLVPNGVNSSAGNASLFVVDALTGARLAEIAADSTGPDNGLTAIAAADTNGDGVVDYVYGGDLKGNVWKFNLSTSSYPGAATALFTPATGTARPIMVAPAVSIHPAGGILVNFGTGQMLEAADISSTTNEYLYGVWDSTKATSTTFAQPVLGTAATTGSPTLQYRTASTVAVDYAKGAKGWRITLSNGERLVGGEALVDSGRYVVTTAVPDPSSSKYGGWLLELNALTGSGPATPFFDLNADGVVDQSGTSDKVLVSNSGSGGTYAAPAGKFLGTGLWSQPVLAQVNKTFDLAYFNFNPNSLLPSVPLTTSTTVADRGVAGGHFDFDIYYNVCDAMSSDYKGSCDKNNTHVHEYDDIYDVVGVNVLAASNSSFNLVNAISSTTTSFKLLLANQKFSPAARLTIGAVTREVWAWPVSPEGFIADVAGGPAKTFTRATVGKLVISLPLNAFTNQEWIPGSGDIRAGLIPTVTGCVRSNTGAWGANTGPWMNGALTMQIVKATTTGSQVELNQAADVKMGYRLKKDSTSQNQQLAQYTMFWHHPNKLCYNAAGWTKTPPPDTVSDASPKTPAAGSDDPKGNFASSAGIITGGTSVSNQISLYNGVEAYIVLTYDPILDEYTRTIKSKATNAILKTETFKDDPSLEIRRADKQLGSRVRLGRMSWQEIVR